MMHITKESILKSLSTVIDPDLKKDLVSLNMIDQIEIDNNQIRFTLTLTTPACPLKQYLHDECVNALTASFGHEIEVEIKMDARVTSHRSKQVELLGDVKNIIAVGSGKGGVGKSTISVNLALALAKTGASVGIVDADIYGPSIPIMFDLVHAKPDMIQEGEKTTIIPIEKYGIKILSIGFFVDPDKALIWRGPMASNALMQLFSDAQWGDLDYLIIDMPPGTGDIQLTLAQRLNLTGMVVVSTPQQVALADARKAIQMFTSDQINVPILGLVENMAWFTPAELPNNKYYIFGKRGAVVLSEELSVPLLGQIPIIQSICEAGDLGVPAALKENEKTAPYFDALAKQTAQQMAIVNAQKSKK